MQNVINKNKGTVKSCCSDSHHSLDDTWVATHPQVIVAAPHRHISLVAQRLRVIISHGELARTTVHRFKHTVRVVTLLLFNLLLEELVITEVGDGWKRSQQRRS